MKVIVQESSGVSLDWLLAKAQSIDLSALLGVANPQKKFIQQWLSGSFRFSSDDKFFHHAIEVDNIELHNANDGLYAAHSDNPMQIYGMGKSRKLAVARHFVIKRLGHESHVPDIIFGEQYRQDLINHF